jgi:hypothetical protein
MQPRTGETLAWKWLLIARCGSKRLLIMDQTWPRALPLPSSCKSLKHSVIVESGTKGSFCHALAVAKQHRMIASPTSFPLCLRHHTSLKVNQSGYWGDPLFAIATRMRSNDSHDINPDVLSQPLLSVRSTHHSDQVSQTPMARVMEETQR